MRPNVDIPWSVHGQIKEYAQAEEQTIEDAYIETLKQGLAAMPTPVQTQSTLKEFSTTQYAFGPREIPASNEEARNINDICTFHPRLSTPRQPVTFKTNWRDIDMDDLEEALVRLYTELDHVHQDWFTFHQLGGAWAGSGAANFIHMLQTAPDRLANADFPTYKTGFAIYLVEIRDSEYLGLRLELDSNGDIDQLSIGFLTDGHPVDGAPYKKYAAQFGLTDLSHGHDTDLQRVAMTLDEQIEVTVIDTVVRDTRQHDEPWVAGLIIENPIQNYPEIHEQFLQETPEQYRESPAYRNQYRQLASYDHAYVQLKNHHPVSEDHSYELLNIVAEDLTSLFGRQSIWNLSITADW